MEVTAEQALAAEFIYSHPGATVADIARAAYISTDDGSDVEFVRRMIDSGLVYVAPTSDVRAVLEGDGGDLDEAATALWHYYRDTPGA